MKLTSVLFICATISASSLNENLKFDIEESPIGVVDLKDDDFKVEAPQTDIFSRMFSKDVLIWSEPDFLVRLYEAQTRGGNILIGRDEDIHMTLVEKIASISREALVGTVYYAFRNKFNLAFEMMIRNLPCTLQEFIESAEQANGLFADPETFNAMILILKHELSDGDAVEYLEELQKAEYVEEDENDELDDEEVDEEEDDDFVVIEHSDAIMKAYQSFKSVMKMELSPEKRLPALIRNLMGFSGASIRDNQVDSRYLKNVILNNAYIMSDLRAVLVLYEAEMMDNSHSHDFDGVIDSYLTKTITLFKKNKTMAQLAYEMYQNNLWAALKKIIDTKFSFKSPLQNPIVFLDIAGLFKIAEVNGYDSAFRNKVIELADVDAVRRYLSQAKAEELKLKVEKEEFKEGNDDDEDEEDFDEVVFHRIKNQF